MGKNVDIVVFPIIYVNHEPRIVCLLKAQHPVQSHVSKQKYIRTYIYIYRMRERVNYILDFSYGFSKTCPHLV